MNGMIQVLAQKFLNGQLQNLPQMQQVNQLLQGKNKQQQLQTLYNFAQSQGVDINQKIFSQSDLKALGFNTSPIQG